MSQRMSQRTRVLNALEMGPVCGTQFLGWHIPRYSARIGELRGEGFDIIRRPCQLHHHESAQFVYELEEPDQMRLAL